MIFHCNGIGLLEENFLTQSRNPDLRTLALTAESATFRSPALTLTSAK